MSLSKEVARVQGKERERGAVVGGTRKVQVEVLVAANSRVQVVLYGLVLDIYIICLQSQASP